jgi:uncharacterized membrane protein
MLVSIQEVFMKSPSDPNYTESNRIYKKALTIGPVLILAMVLFFALLTIDQSTTFGKETLSGSDTQAITYPVSQFADGKAKFFQYKTTGGKTIRYFIVKSSDGIIRAAFDACDVCWPSGKGYYQDGDVMVCRNCGRKFPTPQVNVVTGGCNPSALNRQINKTQVTLQVKDIVAGLHYFNF